MTPDTDSPRRSDAGDEGPIALFVTCLADLLRPSVAFASLRLLERAGFTVEVPEAQTCCGQPGYNSGDYAGAVPVARNVITHFEKYRYVVVPSGSCAGMLRHHYPQLLDGEWRMRAESLATRVWELTAFLDQHSELPPLTTAPVSGGVTYHDACAGLREMGVKDQPRRLLAARCGLAIQEMQHTEVCCGFGGTFCAKMPRISAQMADDKLDQAAETGARLVVGGDLGCLLNLAGRASRRDLPLEFRHVAELLDGDLSAPAIGKPERKGS